jgi:hypothetical protein
MGDHMHLLASAKEANLSNMLRGFKNLHENKL